MGRISNRIRRRMAAAAHMAGALRRATEGGVAMIFALVLPVLLLITLAGLDIHRATTVRMNLQDALDAATLAAARTAFLNDADLTRVGLASLRANLQAYPRIQLREDETRFSLDSDGAVSASARVDVDTLIANIFLPPYGKILGDKLQVGAESEVVRTSKNVEVSLVLDITGSMRGAKLTSLKNAARDLIDIVVQDEQTPFYSRAALVPYSMGVNVGDDYAAKVRGPIAPPAPITAATWRKSPVRTITAISKNSPAVVTANGHGFVNGDKVVIWNSAMTQVNGVVFTVANRTNNTFQLSGVNSRNYRTFTGSASVAACERSDCQPTLTATNHDFRNGDYIYITGLGGMAQLNDATWRVAAPQGDRFRLEAVGSGDYTGGGNAFCTQRGCAYFRFTNASRQWTTHRISTCVSERTGDQAYTDAPAAAAPVGRVYTVIRATEDCLPSQITPLTSNKAALRSQINGYVATGSTAGQIGIGWGWYMVSPRMGALFPGDGRPGDYDPINMLKVVVIMTDGEFNAPYCQDVIASDAGADSGSASTHIDCKATNGSPFAQAEQMCAAMKAQGIIVYTVGFDIPKSIDRTPNVVDTATEVMQSCATTADHVYLPSTGQGLEDAFSAIGREIRNLHISR